MRRFSVLVTLATLLANRIDAFADDVYQVESGITREAAFADVDSIFGDPGLIPSAGCCESIESESLWDNLSIFAGLEGSKQPQDYGVNAHFGGRVFANLGLPLCDHIGLGLQIGSSINCTDNAVQVYDRLGEASGRSQGFTTVGVFQRLDNGLVWAAAWDFLHQNYFDQTNLSQARGRIGWQIGNEEIGIRAQVSHDSDRAFFLGAVPVVLEPVSQGALYWARTWENAARTTLWLGIAESHSECNVAFEALLMPPDPTSDHPASVCSSVPRSTFRSATTGHCVDRRTSSLPPIPEPSTRSWVSPSIPAAERVEREQTVTLPFNPSPTARRCRST